MGQVNSFVILPGFLTVLGWGVLNINYLDFAGIALFFFESPLYPSHYIFNGCGIEPRMEVQIGKHILKL